MLTNVSYNSHTVSILRISAQLAPHATDQKFPRINHRAKQLIPIVQLVQAICFNAYCLIFKSV